MSASEHILGEAQAHADVARIQSGMADPELLLRSVLRLGADAGVLIPPTSRLSGYLCALRKHIERQGRG